MKTSKEEFLNYLQQPESADLEFKEAKTQFDFGALQDYCAGFANTEGGKLILGVKDGTCEVVGTNAYLEKVQKLPNDLLIALGLTISVEEFDYEGKRVLIFHIPKADSGKVIRSKGKYTYPTRMGESLREMDNTALRKKLNATEPDHSSKIVKGLKVEDLDEDALSNFRKEWVKKSGRKDFLNKSVMETVKALGLFSSDGLNYAALILFGKKDKIREYCPDSEIIFEWRHTPGQTSYDFRKDWREPFFKIYNEIWDTIHVRNLMTPLQARFVIKQILAFSEKPIREAILNAVAHRDYMAHGRSIFIRLSPEAFEIESPGGFPEGITPENVLKESFWRNRMIAETFQQVGLVERSGQGMDDIFRSSVEEGKGLPDLSATTPRKVVLRIPATIKDKSFILFLEKISEQKQISFTLEEILELEKIRNQEKARDIAFKEKFLEYGIIEPIGENESDSIYVVSSLL